MTKNTFDLYRCSALLWAGLEYEDALRFRIEKAKEAMTFYRESAQPLDKMSEEYLSIEKKYLDSEDAVKWNRTFLDEIINERKRKIQ